MKTHFSSPGEESAIRDLLDRLNHAWLHGRGEAIAATLNGYFAEDVVMRGPGFALIGRGRDLAVQSYVDFAAQASVKSFSLDPAEIDVWETTAVAQYRWRMTYVLAGQEYTEAGRDLFVLSRGENGWLIIWRELLPDAR